MFNERGGGRPTPSGHPTAFPPGVDPDPRRDASRFGPEDYDLAILATIHPGHDYGWLRRCPLVLDCTYRTHGGRVRVLP